MKTKLGGILCVVATAMLLGACSAQVGQDDVDTSTGELQDTLRCAPAATPGGASCQKTCSANGGILFWDAKANVGHGAYDCVYGTDACWATAPEGLAMRKGPWSSASKQAAGASPCTDLLVRFRATQPFETPTLGDDFTGAPAGTTITRITAPGGECEPFDYLEQSGTAPATKRCWRKVARIPMSGTRYATDRRTWTIGWVRADLLSCGTVKAVGAAANAADATCRSAAISMLPDQVVDCGSMTFAHPATASRNGVASQYEQGRDGFKVRGNVTNGKRYRFAASWMVGAQSFNFSRTIDSRGEYCFFGEGAPQFNGFFVSAQEIDANGKAIGGSVPVAP